MKDLDVFCRAGDYPRILAHLQRCGHEIEVEDERWLAKARRGPFFVDAIFNSTSGVAPVTDRWFEERRTVAVYGMEVPVVPPTELVWSKMFVHRRKPVRIAGIGDLHVAETSAGAWCELFAEIAERADVLALCGDLTNLGTPREAEILADDLRACAVGKVGVLGNHDFESGQPEAVTRILHDAGVFFLEGQAVEIEGIGLAGAKGFAGGFGSRMLSPFGEPAIKEFVAEGVEEAIRLETALRALGTERSIVVLHYAPVAATVEGEPKEIFPFLGSSRLAETIDRFGVSTILHGHAHLGTYAAATEKGIPVYNCARSVSKPSGRPYALIEI